jgi:hypothetical protein
VFWIWTNPPFRKEHDMLWTIFVIVMIMWFLGLESGHMIGGIIHVLLIIAIVVVLIRIIQGENLCNLNSEIFFMR